MKFQSINSNTKKAALIYILLLFSIIEELMIHSKPSVAFFIDTFHAFFRRGPWV